MKYRVHHGVLAHTRGGLGTFGLLGAAPSVENASFIEFLNSWRRPRDMLKSGAFAVHTAIAVRRCALGYTNIMSTKHHPTGKREEVGLPHETRYVRRDDKGHFTADQTDKGESLSRDRQREAKHGPEPGQGDRGDNHE